MPLFPLDDEVPDVAVGDSLPLLDGAGLPALTDGFLAGLASSDSEDGRPSPAGTPVVPTSPEAAQAPIPLFELPDDEDEGPPASPVPATRPRSSIPARTWVVTCALLGLTLVLFIIGVDQLIRDLRARRRARIARRRNPSAPRPGDRGRRGTDPAGSPAEARAGDPFGRDPSGRDPGGLDRAG